VTWSLFWSCLRCHTANRLCGGTTALSTSIGACEAAGSGGAQPLEASHGYERRHRGLTAKAASSARLGRRAGRTGVACASIVRPLGAPGAAGVPQAVKPKPQRARRSGQRFTLNSTIA
jgi:hypothetical protein